MKSIENLIHLESSASTNTYAFELAESGAGHGTVVWTDEQTSGRGQFDRTWVSEKGKDLLFSIILRPKISPKDAPQLTVKVAEILKQIFSNYFEVSDDVLTIKEPNDILLKNKKVCGILTESSSRGEKLDFVIIGIGVNINSSPSQHLPEATSFLEYAGKEFKLEPLLQLIVSTVIGKLS